MPRSHSSPELPLYLSLDQVMQCSALSFLTPPPHGSPYWGSCVCFPLCSILLKLSNLVTLKSNLLFHKDTAFSTMLWEIFLIYVQLIIANRHGEYNHYHLVAKVVQVLVLYSLTRLILDHTTALEGTASFGGHCSLYCWYVIIIVYISLFFFFFLSIHNDQWW